MATMAVNNKTVQCNLELERQLDSGNIKLIQKRSKYVQCDLKLDQHRNENVGNSKTKFRSVATNTDCDESISATCICTAYCEIIATTFSFANAHCP